MLKLEAVQAKDGDCLLLHYEEQGKRRVIVIDGGSAGVYREFLKPRLNQLRGNAPQLKVPIVIVSHIDADHISGILDMFRDINKCAENQQSSPFVVQSLWHNSFDKIMGSHGEALQSVAVGADVSNGMVPAGLEPKTEAVVASVKQGSELGQLGRKYSTINKEFNGEIIMAPEKGFKTLKITPSLTFKIVAPNQNELNGLKDKWDKAKAIHPDNEQAAAADYLNKTVENVSSIVILTEDKDESGETTRMLLTGDANGKFLLEALQEAGLLDDQGNMEVDVLKVQHHGSNHSIAPDFLQRVKANAYVISGNGKHGIPHIDVLRWLSEARSKEHIDVYMTNRKLVNQSEDYTGDLDAFLEEEKKNEPGHFYHFRDEHAYSIFAG